MGKEQTVTSQCEDGYAAHFTPVVPAGPLPCFASSFLKGWKQLVGLILQPEHQHSEVPLV